MNITRLLFALLVGLAVAFNHLLIRQLPSDSGLVEKLKWVSSLVLVPGGLVGWIIAGLKFDDLNTNVVIIANLIFYSGLVYLVLGLWEKHRERNRQVGPMAG